MDKTVSIIFANGEPDSVGEISVVIQYFELCILADLRKAIVLIITDKENTACLQLDRAAVAINGNRPCMYEDTGRVKRVVNIFTYFLEELRLIYKLYFAHHRYYAKKPSSSI